MSSGGCSLGCWGRTACCTQFSWVPASSPGRLPFSRIGPSFSHAGHQGHASQWPSRCGHVWSSNMCWSTHARWKSKETYTASLEHINRVLHDAIATYGTCHLIIAGDLNIELPQPRWHSRPSSMVDAQHCTRQILAQG